MSTELAVVTDVPRKRGIKAIVQDKLLPVVEWHELGVTVIYGGKNTDVAFVNARRIIVGSTRLDWICKDADLGLAGLWIYHCVGLEKLKTCNTGNLRKRWLKNRLWWTPPASKLTDAQKLRWSKANIGGLGSSKRRSGSTTGDTGNLRVDANPKKFDVSAEKCSDPKPAVLRSSMPRVEAETVDAPMTDMWDTKQVLSKVQDDEKAMTYIHAIHACDDTIAEIRQERTRLIKCLQGYAHFHLGLNIMSVTQRVWLRVIAELKGHVQAASDYLATVKNAAKELIGRILAPIYDKKSHTEIVTPNGVIRKLAGKESLERLHEEFAKLGLTPNDFR